MKKKAPKKPSVGGIGWNVDLPYMTKVEAAAFHRLRASGGVSFFRTAACKACKAEVAKGKTYCSKKCYDATEGQKDVKQAD